MLARVSDWRITGRIAVRHEKDSGSGSLHWEQQDAAYTIRIIGPLGRGTLEIVGDPLGVSLSSADAGTIRAADAESLLLAHLGWQVPVAGLRFWIRGIPDPRDPVQSMSLDGQARLAELRQAGWHIRIPAYRSHGGLDLPAKLELESSPLRVKLVIRNWELGL